MFGDHSGSPCIRREREDYGENLVTTDFVDGNEKLRPSCTVASCRQVLVLRMCRYLRSCPWRAVCFGTSCLMILVLIEEVFIWIRGSKTILVVGAGLSGTVIAERIVNTCSPVLVKIVEKRDHIGGNCYDLVEERTGIRIHQYGIHVFHTSDDGVWKYLNQFTSWTPYEHRVLAALESGKFVQVPVNINTVNVLFNKTINTTEAMAEWLQSVQIEPRSGKAADGAEAALARVGPELYRLLFRDYTVKQWNRLPEDLDAGVLERIPVRTNFDDRYFTDVHQALPSHGYTTMFRNMLRHPSIAFTLKTDYFDFDKNMEGRERPDFTFFTGPIDQYFENSGLPKLEYRSLVFDREEVSVPANGSPFHQPVSQINYPSMNTPYTRTIEYAHLPNQEYDWRRQRPATSVLFHETSSNVGEPYYPVPNPRNRALYEKYRELAADEEGVVFVGRLASYKYFDMDDAVRNALDVFYEWARTQNVVSCDLESTRQFFRNVVDVRGL